MCFRYENVQRSKGGVIGEPLFPYWVPLLGSPTWFPYLVPLLGSLIKEGLKGNLGSPY